MEIGGREEPSGFALVFATELKWRGEKGAQRQHSAAICSSTTYKELFSKQERER